MHLCGGLGRYCLRLLLQSPLSLPPQLVLSNITVIYFHHCRRALPKALDSVSSTSIRHCFHGRLKLMGLERSMGQKNSQTRCIRVIGKMLIKVNANFGFHRLLFNHMPSIFVMGMTIYTVVEAIYTVLYHNYTIFSTLCLIQNNWLSTL